MTAPTVSATQNLAWTGSAQVLVQAPENASIKFRYKKSTDDAYSDWSTTVPPQRTSEAMMFSGILKRINTIWSPVRQMIRIILR